MTTSDVLEFVSWMSEQDIDFIIDGGWGVDALLGRQTRRHVDLDIALLHPFVPKLRAMLEAKGFHDYPVDDSWECNFVLEDELQRRIDIHSCTFDENGKNVFGVAYPLDSWSGTGQIGGKPVRCISPDWMVKFHTGYPLDDNDYQDVKALCARFQLPIPEDYNSFIEKDQNKDGI